MSTLRFEPIATQVGKHTSPALLFPSDLLEAIGRNDILDQTDPAWTPVVLELMSHYAAVIEIAHLLLGSPPFDRLARLYDALKEEYAPDNGTRSPVYDSLLVQHVLGGVPQGVAGETPLGVLARLSRGDAARARLQEMAQNLSLSHLDLYRVTRIAGLEGEVVPLRGGEPFALHVTGPFLREGDRVLGRVVEFEGRRFMADSPYLLEAAEEEWLDYVERVAEAAAASSSASDAAGRAKPKLTSKQAARRRKELKAKAARNAPSELVVRHLRYGSSERFWLDYVMDGFAGARRGLVRLAGVPDRPETLPQHRDYDGPELASLSEAALRADFDDGDVAGDDDDLADDDFSDDDFSDDVGDGPSAMARVRDELAELADREGIFDREMQSLLEALRELGATPELEETDEPLLEAYCTLAVPTGADGATLLARLPDEVELDDDEREAIARLERGRFAVLRIDRIHLDAGFEMFDLLREEALRIDAGAVTHYLGVGALLLAWFCMDGAGRRTLEWEWVHVPTSHAAAFAEIVASQRGGATPRLAVELLARWVALREGGLKG